MMSSCRRVGPVFDHTCISLTTRQQIIVPLDLPIDLLVLGVVRAVCHIKCIICSFLVGGDVDFDLGDSWCFAARLTLIRIAKGRFVRNLTFLLVLTGGV